MGRERRARWRLDHGRQRCVHGPPLLAADAESASRKARRAPRSCSQRRTAAASPMSIAGELVGAGITPGRIDVTCLIVMDEVEGQGHQIVGSHVEAVVAAEGLDDEGLQAALAKADEGCPSPRCSSAPAPKCTSPPGSPDVQLTSDAPLTRLWIGTKRGSNGASPRPHPPERSGPGELAERLGRAPDVDHEHVAVLLHAPRRGARRSPAVSGCSPSPPSSSRTCRASGRRCPRSSARPARCLPPGSDCAPAACVAGLEAPGLRLPPSSRRCRGRKRPQQPASDSQRSMISRPSSVMPAAWEIKPSGASLSPRTPRISLTFSYCPVVAPGKSRITSTAMLHQPLFGSQGLQSERAYEARCGAQSAVPRLSPVANALVTPKSPALTVVGYVSVDFPLTSCHYPRGRAVETLSGASRSSSPPSSATLAVAVAGAASLAAPTAITGSVTAIGGSTATVNGTVNANGKATTWQFEYGTTTGYGSKAPTHRRQRRLGHDEPVRLDGADRARPGHDLSLPADRDVERRHDGRQRRPLQDPGRPERRHRLREQHRADPGDGRLLDQPERARDLVDRRVRHVDELRHADERPERRLGHERGQRLVDAHGADDRQDLPLPLQRHQLRGNDPRLRRQLRDCAGADRDHGRRELDHGHAAPS